VEQIPRQERGVALGELVLKTDTAAVSKAVAVAWAGTRFADPSGVGLRRDRIADVLQAVEDVGRAMFDAVLIASDQAASNLAVVEPLTSVVQLTRMGVEPLDYLLRLAAVVTEPDRARDDQDVRTEHSLEQLRPCVSGPVVLTHVWVDPCRDRIINSAKLIDVDTMFDHDRRAGIDQELRMAQSRRSCQRRIDEEGRQFGEIGLTVRHGDHRTRPTSTLVPELLP